MATTGEKMTMVSLKLALSLTLTLFFIPNGCISFMDMEELKSVYYGLDILKEPVSIAKEVPPGAVYVTSKYGQQYQCTFPDHSSEEKRKEEEEKMAMETGIVDLLRPMGDKPCLFKGKDWWSYEFCYGKHIRQFHMEDGDIKGNIIYLGYYQSDFDWSNETAKEARLKSKTGQNRFHTQNYALGTKCDLTGQMRRAEVRFVCEENSEDFLARVDESETCVYTVTVMTSRICRHPYLKAPARRKPVPITCNPLLSEEQFQSYKHELEEEKLRLQQEREKAQPFDELFGESNKDMSRKEIFEKIFGEDEILWQAYLHHMDSQKGEKELARKKLSQVVNDFKKMGALNDKSLDKQTKSMSINDDTERQAKPKSDAEEVDEDDEIFKEFEDEIEEIKSKFDDSRNTVSKIKRKVNLDKRLETEMQEAIEEAERELGVKFDRSLLSGLSNTVDKLVNKLQDTKTELASSRKELNKLKADKSITTSKDKQATGIFDSEDDDDDDDYDGEQKKKDGKETQTESKQEADMNIQAPPRTSSDPVGAGSSATNTRQDRPPTMEEEEQGGNVGFSNNAGTGFHQDDSVLSPDGQEGAVTAGQTDPDIGAATQGSDHLDTNGGTEDILNSGGANGVAVASADKAASAVADGVSGKDNSDDEDDAEAELTVTVRKTDNTKAELPENVQKLLEDSIKKEYKKNRLDDDSQPLSFDTDHSFQREKTVHVIQSEDEDGKTNRYIFVFGFNNFNDETAEKERQSALEENYGFVYSENKNKKSAESGNEN